MKISLKIVLLLLLPFFSFAQNLSNATDFKKVVKLAQDQQKPILVIIGVKIPVNIDYKIAPNLALADPEILKKMKDNFVVFESDNFDPSLSALIAKYKIRSFPYYLFLHPNEDAYHAEFGLMSNKIRFKLMLERALVLSKEKSMTALESDYLLDKNNNELIKKLITLRRKNGLTDNADLIEKFASNLRIADLNDYETVLFILQAGPHLDGNAYKYAITNRKTVDSIYKKESAQVRSDFTNTIINNTMLNAKKTKNLNQALTATNFLRNSWGRDYITGNKNANSQMLSYYLTVKDTANYFRNAITHYDTYYMNISADSIKRLEAKLQQTALNNAKKAPFSPPTTLTKTQIDSLKANPNTVTRRETISVMSNVNAMSNSYANELNTAAWSFYETGTKNINHLLKAIAWSKRSLELSIDNPSYLDTQAHILYRLGYNEQAQSVQENAINQAKIKGVAYENMKVELKKMKSKTL